MVIRVLCVLHCICTLIFMRYLAFFSHADKKCSKIMLLQFLKCLTALAWRILRISCYLLAGCIYVTTKDDHSPDCLNKTSILNHIGIVFRLWLSKRAGREKKLARGTQSIRSHDHRSFSSFFFLARGAVRLFTALLTPLRTVLISVFLSDIFR